MPISKIRQGAYREIASEELENLGRPPAKVQPILETGTPTIPMRLDISAYIWHRVYELENTPNMKVDEICCIISKELTEMGHDARRARRILPSKYKNVEMQKIGFLQPKKRNR
jgi:hypothetical protein